MPHRRVPPGLGRGVATRRRPVPGLAAPPSFGWAMEPARRLRPLPDGVGGARARSGLGHRRRHPRQLPPQPQDPGGRVPQALCAVRQPVADPALGDRRAGHAALRRGGAARRGGGRAVADRRAPPAVRRRPDPQPRRAGPPRRRRLPGPRRPRAGFARARWRPGARGRCLHATLVRAVPVAALPGRPAPGRRAIAGDLGRRTGGAGADAQRLEAGPSSGNRSTAMNRRSLAAALVALPFLAAAAMAQAQARPARPIKMVVPFTPGDGPDVLARLIGDKIGERLGQPVIVDNKPGASAQIGPALVAKAAPDGYTLGVGLVTNLALAPHTHKTLPYDPLKDFAPVALGA
ncbi:MAG: hypothetical protein EOO24_61000, partial [Comamonadaceae bacterium]